jgi:DUF177 domain-containing protein
MPANNTIDLSRLGLSPGQGRRLDLELEPEPLELGGERYTFSPRTARARLDISRTAAGHALRLSFAGEFAGPCTRCLEDARVPVKVEAREVDQPRSGEEELSSPYVVDELLDLAAWARDALALAVPSKLLCRADCAGLCPVCGVSLNDADPDEHRHETGGDPRWDKLRELKLD